MRITLALAALLSFQSPSQAAQFHANFHTPPRLNPAPGSGASFALAGGWSSVSAPGLRVEGPGGGWELAFPLGKTLGGNIHAEGFALSGRVDPLSAGRRKTTGFAGNVEGELTWPAAESLRAYAGLSVGLTVLDVADPVLVQFSAGKFRAEPDLASSLLIGVPFGLTASREFGRCSGSATLYALLYPGGATFFNYGIALPAAFGSSRRIDAHFAAGARLRLEYTPWGLGVEAGGGASSASGNNDGAVSGYAGLGWRIL